MPPSRDGERQAVAEEFLHWVSVARQVVADHFPAERTEPHNMMVIDTARSLMLADRVGRVETSLQGLHAALSCTKEI